MGREIKEKQSYGVTPLLVPADFAEEPFDWLAAQAGAYGLVTLLAHADDGVIWGRFVGRELILSGRPFEEVSPRFRAITLRQLRFFGERAELLVWRDGQDDWWARLVDDQGSAETGCCFDEWQLLWGDRAVGESQDGFTLVADGKEGLLHTVPRPAADIPFDDPARNTDRWRPLRLQVRHYLAREADGALSVVQSRLVKLSTIGREKK